MIPCPDGLEYMPFQIEGINFALQRQDTLLADEPGLGKTIQAAGVINAIEEDLKILVVCPASLSLNWQRELEKWLTPARSIAAFTKKGISPDVDITITNYGILDRHMNTILDDQRWDLLIADEVHFVKNNQAKRSKAFYEIARHFTLRLYLTGTPILNKPIDLFHIAQSLGFGPAKDWMHFVRKYCDAKQKVIGYDRKKKKQKKVWDTSGASNLKELNSNLSKTIMIRRLKKNVLTELPPKRRQIIVFPGTQMSLIERNWWTNLEMPYKEKVLSLSLDHTIAFSDLSTIRYESAMAKVPLVVEHIKNTLESEEKLVVFAHHKKVAAEIGAAFKGVVTYTGDHTVEQRQAAVDAFQEDPNVRLFVGTKAAWVGITLTAASIVIFAELDWVPGDVTQGEDRLHRKGQKNAVLVQHLVVDGSIDAKIAQILVAKQEILDAALGGGE